MLISALLVFTLAAIGGIILALRVLGGRLAPWLLSLLHAALGATGLVLLLVVVQRAGDTLTSVSLLLFLLAAAGGFLLASFHLRQKLPPKAILILHAALAVSAFALLVAAVVLA